MEGRWEFSLYKMGGLGSLEEKREWGDEELVDW